MFFKTRTVRDLKSNPRGTGIIRESLDFDDPSWIIEHHRHNLITKISKPKSSWFEGFRNLEQNLKSRLDLEYGRDHDQEISGENQQQNHNDGRPTTQSEHEGPNRNEQSYRVSLSELQRLHLRQLQHKLLNKVVDLRYDGMEPPGWADDLRQYVQALRDYDYMGQHIGHPHDPFYITGERFIDRWMLHFAMKDREDPRDPLQWANPMGNWETGEHRPEPIGGTRDENVRKARVKGFRQRLGVAVVGGAFLIGPMWLMVLHNTLYTALVSTTVCVVIFGFVMALRLDRPMDVLSNTAAYAAVLVVFVGLTTTK